MASIKLKARNFSRPASFRPYHRLLANNLSAEKLLSRYYPIESLTMSQLIKDHNTMLYPRPIQNISRLPQIAQYARPRVCKGICYIWL